MEIIFAPKVAVSLLYLIISYLKALIRFSAEVQEIVPYYKYD